MCETWPHWSTFPSAHSSISCKGSRARYMEVVLHHIGRPRKTTTAQKDKMTRLRTRMLSVSSGGGLFFAETTSSCGTGSSAASEDIVKIKRRSLREAGKTASHELASVRYWE